MEDSELKKQLGDELCAFCPWKNGEIDHQFDGHCVRVYIAMKHLKHLWTRTENFLMMMRNN